MRASLSFPVLFLPHPGLKHVLGEPGSDVVVTMHVVLRPPLPAKAPGETAAREHTPFGSTERCLIPFLCCTRTCHPLHLPLLLHCSCAQGKGTGEQKLLLHFVNVRNGALHLWHAGQAVTRWQLLCKQPPHTHLAARCWVAPLLRPLHP